MNPNVMNIFCSINNNYTEQLCVTMVSILENNQWGSVRFYVLTSDLTEVNRKKVKEIIKHYDNCELHFPEINRDLFRDCLLNRDHITVETYFRYVIADLVPDLDRALYMDVDVAVNGSLEPLWKTDLDGYYLAGVCDLDHLDRPEYYTQLGFREDDLYVNAGMLLMNLALIRKDKLVEQFFANTWKWTDYIEFQDQDIINITCKGKMKAVDSIYNYCPPNIVQEPEKKKRAVLIHYYGLPKPWSWNCDHPMRKVWQRYARINEAIQNTNLKVALIVDEESIPKEKLAKGYAGWIRELSLKYFPDQKVKIDVLFTKCSARRFLREKKRENRLTRYRLPASPIFARSWIKHRNYQTYLLAGSDDNYVFQCDPDWKNKQVIRLI